jgi:hypothetical protein
MAFSATKFFMTLSTAIWLVALAVNFILLYKAESALLWETRKEDKWLLAQCQDPVFAARMHIYNDPCAAALRRTNVNVPMMSFHLTLDKLFLCGSYSCEGIVWMFLERARANIFLLFVALVCCLMLVPAVVLPFWRKFTENVAEQHIRERYNMPWGVNPQLLNAYNNGPFYDNMHEPPRRQRVLGNV